MGGRPAGQRPAGGGPAGGKEAGGWLLPLGSGPAAGLQQGMAEKAARLGGLRRRRREEEICREGAPGLTEFGWKAVTSSGCPAIFRQGRRVPRRWLRSSSQQGVAAARCRFQAGFCEEDGCEDGGVGELCEVVLLTRASRRREGQVGGGGRRGRGEGGGRQGLRVLTQKEEERKSRYFSEV